MPHNPYGPDQVDDPGLPRRGEVEATRPPVAAIVAAVVVIALVATAVVALVLHYRSTRSEASTPTPTLTYLAPPNLTRDGAAIISTAPGARPEAVTVEIHTDYQCPACAVYEEFFGAAFGELIRDGEVVAHFHLRTFLDARKGNDASTRAAVGATCADTVASFQAYHDALFLHQSTGYPDTLLRDTIPQTIGLTGGDLAAFQVCYDNRLTVNVVTAMEQINARNTVVTGTPTYLVNGVPIDLTQTPPDAASLLATLRAAA